MSVHVAGHSKSLKYALGAKVREILVPYRYDNIPFVRPGHMFKLEGYALCYDNLEITIKTKGQVEFYVDDDTCLIQDEFDDCTVQLSTGIHPITCYIKPTEYPVSYELSPNIFVLNNGYIEFTDPKPLTTKLLNFRFVNPEKHVRQKYYIGTRKLKTYYYDYKHLDDKYTDTTVVIPPEDES